MRNNKWFWGAFLLLMVTQSCDNQANHSKSGILSIDIEKYYLSQGKVFMLSDLVRDIEYVKLETKENCYLAQTASPEFISEKYILIRQYSPPRILLFSRSGKYLNDIGVYGSGPGEFASLLNPKISPDERYVLFNDRSKGLLLYNIDGTFVDYIDQRKHRFRDFGFTREGLIVGFKERTTLPVSGGYQILLFDSGLNQIDSLLYSPFDDVPPIMFTWDQMMTNNASLYYENRLNDTIFKIAANNTCVPEVVLHLGRFKIPGPNTRQPEIYNYFDVINFTNTPNYYLITFFNDPKYKIAPRVGRAFFLFDKETAEGHFLKPHEIMSPEGLVESKFPDNDLDGLSTPPIFYTQSLNYDPNQIVCLDKLEISGISDYQEKGMLDSGLLSNHLYFKRLQVLLKQSDIEDNPIIRICYLK